LFHIAHDKVKECDWENAKSCYNSSRGEPNLSAISRGNLSQAPVLLQEHFPHLTEDYRDILFDVSASDACSAKLATMVNRLAAKQGLDAKLRLCL
jgi:hypothetical protein